VDRILIRRGVGARRRRRASPVLSLVVLTVIAAGCSAKASARSSPGSACHDVRYGCIRIAIGDPIEIGALLDIGPNSGDLGTDSQRGIQLAIDYLDGIFDGIPGQLLGHDIVLTPVDDGCNRQQGAAGAALLAREPTLVGVIGTSCSASAFGAADEVLSEHGTVLISPSNTAPALTDPTTHARFYSRVAENDKIQGAVVGQFAAQTLGGKRAVTIDDGTVYTTQITDIFTRWFELFGGTVLATDRLADPPDLGALADLVARTQADVVYLPLVGDPCARVAEALRADPRTRAVKLVVSDGCMTSTVLAAAGNAPGLFASTPDERGLLGNPFYAQSFLPAYRRQFGQAPTSPYNANAFDAANVLFDAVRRSVVVGPGTILTISRERLREALLQINGYRGLSGLIACTPTGDCQQSATIAVYQAPQWPVAGGNLDAEPIYSVTKTLRDVERSS
jgi:branched-chain amino acid transport system substrate-binding protein